MIAQQQQKKKKTMMKMKMTKYCYLDYSQDTCTRRHCFDIAMARDSIGLFSVDTTEHQAFQGDFGMQGLLQSS